MEIEVFTSVVSVRVFIYEKVSIKHLRGKNRTQFSFSIAFKSQ